MLKMRTQVFLLASILVSTGAWAQQAPPSPKDTTAEFEQLKKRVEALEKALSDKAQSGITSAPMAQPAATLPVAAVPGGIMPVPPSPPSALPAVETPGTALPNQLDAALQRVPSTNEPLFPGWVVHVLAQPPRPSEVPKREVGIFVWTSQEPITLAAFRKEGIGFEGGAAYMLTGWLRIEQPGPYQIGITIRNPVEKLLTEDMRCSVAMQVGRTPLGEESTQLILRKTAVWIGDVELKTGLYPISAMIRCPGVVGKFAADRAVIESYQISNIFKRPGEQQSHTMPPDMIVHPRSP